MKRKRVRIALFVLEIFIALTAIVGGLVELTGTMQIPLEWLRNSLFSDYTIPMLILILVVGGSSLAAAATVFVRREWSVLLSVVAGVVMAGFEVVELLILRQFSWLQVFYFVIGIAVFGLASSLWVLEYLGHHIQPGRVEQV